MCQTSYVAVKNHIELLAFDVVGVAAVNSVIEVEPSGDNERLRLASQRTQAQNGKNSN